VLALGAVLRVAWVAHAGVPPRFVTDPEAYLLQGEQIAHGHGYTNPLVRIANEQRAAAHQTLIPEQPSTFYPPGYPTFVGAVAWAVYHSPIPDDDGAVVRAVGFVQALLGVLSILMLYELARRVAGEIVGLVAALMLAIFPGLVTLTATLQLETVFITLTLATMLVVLPLATTTEPKRSRLLIGGAVIGAVALVRPTIALLVVAYLVTRLVMRRPWRETVVGVLLIVVAMLALVIPWTIRNALDTHQFVAMSTGIGPALCMARNVEASGHIDSRVLAARCQSPVKDRSPSDEDIATNNFATRQAIKWTVHHPLDELRMWWWRSFYAYQHDTTGFDDYSRFMSPRWREVLGTVSDSASFVVLALAVLGAVAVLLTSGSAGVFLVASTVCFAAVPIMLFGDPRYRMPAEPLFIVLAAAAVCAAVDGIRSRRARGSPILSA
jgi:4-amino-4-deoxy-L-arabinose transferase-like glycosyltransferase